MSSKPNISNMKKEHFELVLNEYLELISITPRRLSPNSEDSKDAKTLATLGPLIYGGDYDDARPRKLCLIFGWFAARKKHLMKFAQLYLHLGFDALLAKNSAAHVRDPVGAARVSKEA